MISSAQGERSEDRNLIVPNRDGSQRQVASSARRAAHAVGSCLVALAAMTMVVPSASAIIISSAPFSLGYGWTGNSSGWSTFETAGANTATTIGDFTFSPTVTSSGVGFSTGGPTFDARVLTTPAADNDSAREDRFGATIDGSWSGTAPSGSQVSIRINIDQVSIWATVHPAFQAGAEEISFVESTPGNAATSPPLTGLTIVADSTQLRIATNYQQLIWNPSDIEVPGTSFTRTFALTAPSIRPVDGFEIEGTIDIIITPPVPEPSTFTLLGFGALSMVRHIRRRRRKRVR